MSLQQWVPTEWNQVVGNYILKDIFKGIVKIKTSYGSSRLPDQALLNLLVTGKSRSGKTSTIKLLLRSLLCDEVTPDTFKPCQTCDGCAQTLFSHQNAGCFGESNVRLGRYEYVPIDCSRVKGKEDLEKKLYHEILYRSVPRIYFLDEVHLLKSLDRDSMLLRALDDHKAIWLLASAKPELIDPMLRGRLAEVETEPPELEELAHWVLTRADEAGLQLSTEDAMDLADRYLECPGKILNQLKLRQFREAN